MGGFLVDETLLFLKACLLGGILGVIFDLFRIFRTAIKCNTIIVFIQDVLYFTVVTASTFIFLLMYNDGRLRMFILVGELMGSVLYFFSISILVLKSSRKIIFIFKKVLRVILYPFIAIINFVNNKINLIKSKILKKIKLFDKFSLKNILNIVYNKRKSKNRDTIN